MIAMALAALAWSAAPDPGADRPASGSAQTPSVAESPVTEAARQWLALVDAAKWRESFAGTTKRFQTVNTFEMWHSASVEGRVPLGRVLSRRLLSEEDIPVPPNGNQLVRFMTDFAAKPGATERITLVREGGSWRIVGYIIE